MKRLTLILLLTLLVISCDKSASPVISSLIATPDSVYPVDTVTITYQVYDEDDPVLQSGLTCETGKLIPCAQTDPLVSEYQWVAPKQPGDHYIKLLVFDTGHSATASVKVVVRDTSGSFTDARDNHSYKWVKIGTQIWMAENLAYLPELVISPFSSAKPFYFVYGYNGTDVAEAKATDPYNAYGVLYNKAAATNACPAGWHLPSDDEWKVLEKHLGMNQNDLGSDVLRTSGSVGNQLKETGTTYWRSPNSGSTNITGFSARPGGEMGYNTGYTGFMDARGTAYFWSGTLNTPGSSWIRNLDNGYAGIDRHYMGNGDGLSVRCVKD